MRGSLVGAILGAALAASPDAAGQVFVTPSTPGWAFATETPTGSGAFVVGPVASPLGSLEASS